MSADINRLEHIIEAVDRIQNYTAVEYADYEKSLEKQDAVISNFFKLGEAAGKISPELKTAHPEVNWRNAIGMRNVLVHDYVKIDYKELWLTAKNDLPALKKQIQKILEDISEQ